MPNSAIARKMKHQKQRWYVLVYERVTAMLVFVNILVVLFDISYVPLRDFWLQGRIELYWLRALGIQKAMVLSVPILSNNLDASPVTKLYDPIKGIEPNQETTRYLNLVEELRKVSLINGIASPESEKLMAQLREKSADILISNPFEEAGKSARLSQIRGRMVEHVKPDDQSAQKAFSEFWTADYLKRVSPDDGFGFFKQQIEPLFRVNYSRLISESGTFVDYFPLLDLPFVAFFFMEFMVRTFLLSRRYSWISWRDAMLWRWYDIFLFVPVFRFLRLIPALIRLSEADLFNVSGIRAQVSQGFLSGIGSELTEVVVIQVLNQVQASIRQGEMTKLLANADESKYVDINNTNEIAEIGNLLIQLLVYKVLPSIQSDIRALLHYNLESAINQVPGMARVQALPGLNQVSKQMSREVATLVTDRLYAGVIQSYEDEQGRQLTAQLQENFTTSLSKELRQAESLDKIRNLLVDLIEEIKINYVERLAKEDMEAVLEETRRLRSGTESES